MAFQKKVSSMRVFPRKHGIVQSGVSVVALLSLVSWLVADPPEAPKVSEFAKAADLVEQLNFYVESLTETAADAGAYDDDAKDKVNMEANTLVTIAMALGLHDEENRYRTNATAIANAAKAVAQSRADHTQAKDAVAKLRATVEQQTANDGTINEWKKLAALGALMKQVPIIDARIQRSVSPRRFSSRGKNALGDLATLAVIAQAAMYDTHEVKDEADLPAWYEYCASLRDSAKDMAAGIRANDLEGTSAAAERMLMSCDNCHADFRIE